MNKGMKTYLPLWFVLCVIVNVIAWVIPVEHDTLFYTSYGFIMGSLLVQLAVVMISLREKQKDVKIPAVVFSVAGTLLTILVSFICLFLQAKPWIVTVLGTVILGLNIITVLLSNSTRERAIERDLRNAGRRNP